MEVDGICKVLHEELDKKLDQNSTMYKNTNFTIGGSGTISKTLLLIKDFQKFFF